ncbi:flavin reductase [Streptomyces chrestomyceticus]|uniref:flavin reductase n=1 Tax=Streptomyces chrestomyceticus TaxID=68185 RepID=UPI0037BDE362
MYADVLEYFAGTRWSPSRLGNPLLPGAVLWIDCGLQETREVGDHLLVVGRVADLRSGDLNRPLVFHANGLHSLPARG